MSKQKALELPPPDSINDRILCAISAIGESATRAGIGRSVKCNDSLLAIAIDALERDGYIQVAEKGHYVLHDSLLESYRFYQPVEALAATSAPVNDVLARSPECGETSAIGRQASTRTDEDITPRVLKAEVEPVKKKICISRRGGKSCGRLLPIDEFYEGSSNCKTCVVARQKELKDAKKKGQTPPAAKGSDGKGGRKVKAVAAVAVPTELVIPAKGEICCQLLEHHGAVQVSQYDQVITFTAEQLQRFLTWSTDVQRSLT